MGVKNFPLYKVTEHARDRIRTRFNITNTEFDGWMSRLLSQGEFVEKQNNNREKYRLNDIVFIIDTCQKQVVTVYSQNEHDDLPINVHTNPEVKSAINLALETMIKQKKVKMAIAIHENLDMMVQANSRMVKPYTNYRFTDAAWDEFIENFRKLEENIKSGMAVINEAKAKIEEG